ncbi:MAG: tetratricopeptide repeat protein [Bryobacteraceae bacterium]|nr:tetratricopeptide repeat protein [Bryobacteraceae bacterium]
MPLLYGADLLSLAAGKLQNSDAPGAAKLLRAHLAQSPRDAAAWNLLGVAETEQKRGKAADAAFDRAIALQPDSSATRENYGTSLYKRGEFGKAKSQLAEAARLGATNPGVLYQLAVSRLRTGEAEVGLRDLSGLRDHFATLPEYWQELGIAQSVGDLNEASQSLDRALSLDSESVRSLAAAAFVAERRNDTERALVYLLKARALAPASVPLLVQFGRVCLQRELGQDSLEALGKAHRAQPGHQEALYLLAAANITVEQFQEAYKLLVEFTRQAPGNATAHHSLGWLDLKLNRPESARSHFDQALKLAPDFPNTLLELADLDLISGDLDRSEQSVMRALKQKPNSARGHLILGDIANQRGDIEKAQNAYETAIRHDENLAAAHSRLARILFRKRDVAGGTREQKLAAALQELDKKQSRRALRLAGMDPSLP